LAVDRFIRLAPRRHVPINGAAFTEDRGRVSRHDSSDFTAREDASALVFVAVVGREQCAVADVVVKDVEAWSLFSQSSSPNATTSLSATPAPAETVFNARQRGAAEQERAALLQQYAATRALYTRWQQDLRTAIPTARIVELPGANIDMFLTNEADVLREIRAFAATLTGR
jgi:hypothetical protein